MDFRIQNDNLAGLAPAFAGLALIETGVLNLANQNYTSALENFSQSLGFHNGCPDAYYYFHVTSMLLGDHDLSAQTINLAKERFPEMFTAEGEFGVFPTVSNDEPLHLIAAGASDPTASVNESRKVLASSQEARSKKEIEMAIDCAFRALELNPWNCHALYLLAKWFAECGETAKAVKVLENAISVLPFTFKRSSRVGEFQGFTLDAPVTKAYYRALSEFFPDISILLVDQRQEGDVKVRLKDLYLQHREAWLNSEERWNFDNQSEPAAEYDRSLLLVSPKYIKCQPDWVEYDATLHMEGIVRKIFSETHVHYADDIHSEGDQLPEPRSAQMLSVGIGRLRTVIEETKPEFVYFDGNYLGGKGGIAREDFESLKGSHSFRLVIMVGDIYPPKPNFAEYWSTVADVIVAFNRHPYMDEARANCPVVEWLGQPIDLDIMTGSVDVADRRGIFYVGARKGYRDLWCSHLTAFGEDFDFRFTDQSRKNSLDLREYVDKLANTKLAFNSGMVSSRDHSPNFKICEAMASGAVLLQQDFPMLRDYFRPYVHYAPFSNVGELVATAEYILEHDEVCESISKEARNWYRKNYAGASFWKAIMDALEKAP